MTTKEKIEKKVKKHNKSNKLVKIIGFAVMSIAFGFMVLIWQSLSYEVIDNRTDDFVYVEHGKNKVEIFTNSTSENMSQWIYSQYTYLESVDEILASVVFFGSSFLFSGILIFFLFMPLFGTNDRWFYEQFNINFTVNGNPVTVNDEKLKTMIKGLRIISKLEDLGGTYKFKASLYDLVGRGTEEYEVEKWKVTSKVNKWIWF